MLRPSRHGARVRGMSSEPGHCPRVLASQAQISGTFSASDSHSTERFVDLFFACKGRVVVAGMGKSPVSLAKKFRHTFRRAPPSFFRTLAEAWTALSEIDCAWAMQLLAVSTAATRRNLFALLDALKRIENSDGRNSRI